MTNFIVMTFYLLAGVIVEEGLTNVRVGKDISQYIPESGDLEGWEPVDHPQIFVGDELYQLINGGAVIYHEYGFKRVITQEYVNANEEKITLELYEMNNPSAAYGMYTFKTYKGKEMSVGTDALLEDYYLNFWKGKYVVTLIGFDSTEESVDGLLSIANVIDSKIKKGGKKPPLVDLLLNGNPQSSDVTYLRGVLALSNSYQFGHENIFGLKEGVIGRYENYSIFIFKYLDESECLKWFKNVIDYLEHSDQFDAFVVYPEAFSMKDKQGQHIYCEPHENYIFIGSIL